MAFRVDLIWFALHVVFPWTPPAERDATPLKDTPRQSVGGGKYLQKRACACSSLLKTIVPKGKLTFGDSFFDSGVARLCSTSARF